MASKEERADGSYGNGRWTVGFAAKNYPRAARFSLEIAAITWHALQPACTISFFSFPLLYFFSYVHLTRSGQCTSSALYPMVSPAKCCTWRGLVFHIASVPRNGIMTLLNSDLWLDGTMRSVIVTNSLKQDGRTGRGLPTQEG